jgi:hypothetical protein
MNRRDFLSFAGTAPWAFGPLAAVPRAGERHTDVVIIGGGLGGCAAALAAARHGRRVILTEETDWIGGQLTQQAVPPDEHPWIEQFGCTRSYRQLRNGIRDYYRRHYPMTSAARAAVHLNPGNGSVSALCHEPRVALAVLQAMFAPYASGGRVALMLEYKAVSAEMNGDRVAAVTVRHQRTGTQTVLTAPYFIDATELGDLLPLTKTEYVTGAESRQETGEPHAPAQARPADQQAFTCCFAVDYPDGEDHTIARPAEYDFWRRYMPTMRPAWPGPLLSWRMSDPRTLGERAVHFDPTLQQRGAGLNLWLYRRIIDRRNFTDSAFRGDACLVNWPQNDYLLGNLVGVSAEELGRHVNRGKQLSLSLLYWMQTEAPRPKGKSGWRGLRLRRDIVGTDDGLAKYPYVRESRRIRAEFTVLEQHVSTDARMKATGQALEQLTAERFADSVGIGSYRIDLHPTSGGGNYIDISSLPFQIPLGALIPRRVENLLAGNKNIGTTHITNGCYRLHPVEWNIGEAAGAAVAFCLERKEPPRRVRRDTRMLGDSQRMLQADGVELSWPQLRPR